MKHHKKHIIAMSLCSAAFLSGCQSTFSDFVEVRTLDDNGNVVAVNGKQVETRESETSTTDEKVLVTKQATQTIRNDAQTSISEQSSRYREYTILTEYDINVDLAARAIQRQFNFQSPQEIRRQNGDLAADFMIRDNAYRWDVAPGSYYNFRRSFAIEGRGYNIDFEIVRLNDNKSNVIATYWVKTNDAHNKGKVNDFIRNKMRNALMRYL